jgi:hypothetical protein
MSGNHPPLRRYSRGGALQVQFYQRAGADANEPQRSPRQQTELRVRDSDKCLSAHFLSTGKKPSVGQVVGVIVRDYRGPTRKHALRRVPKGIATLARLSDDELSRLAIFFFT